MPKKTPANDCPCGSGLPYAGCCGPLHAGELAAGAEQLMRSRYSAYVLGLQDYILQTWHPATRPAQLSLDPDTRWLGLKVKSNSVTGPDAATVSFEARFKIGGGSAQRLREISDFARIGGRWLYHSGKFET